MGNIADKIARKAQNKKRHDMGLPPVLSPIEQRQRDSNIRMLRNHSGSTMTHSQETPPNKLRPSRMESWEVDQTHSKMKYIVVDHPKAGIIAQTFHGCLIHAEMARASYLREGEVLGAGFYDVHVYPNGEVSLRVFGRSESLDISSRPIDREYVAKQLGLIHFLKD